MPRHLRPQRETLAAARLEILSAKLLVESLPVVVLPGWAVGAMAGCLLAGRLGGGWLSVSGSKQQLLGLFLEARGTSTAEFSLCSVRLRPPHCG